MAVGGDGSQHATTPRDEPDDDLDLHPDSSLGREENPELLPRNPALARAFHGLGLAEQAIGTILIVVILVLVLVQVAQRYLPGGYPWTGEVARLALVWCTFVMSGYLMAFDRHISIHVVDLVLPRRALGLIRLMGHLFVAATCIGMTYACYRLIEDDIGQKTAAAEIPLAWIYLVPMVGFALTALRAVMAVGLVDLPHIAGREEAR
jgi:TRAP-type C4-dicarboxylate transport system permease small subunit